MHQLFKYNFESESESAIEGVYFKEEQIKETKIQFFEQAKVQQQHCTTEEEFLMSTYVSRQDTITEPWKKGVLVPYEIFKLDNIHKPVY